MPFSWPPWFVPLPKRKECYAPTTLTPRKTTPLKRPHQPHRRTPRPNETTSKTTPDQKLPGCQSHHEDQSPDLRPHPAIPTCRPAGRQRPVVTTQQGDSHELQDARPNSQSTPWSCLLAPMQKTGSLPTPNQWVTATGTGLDKDICIYIHIYIYIYIYIYVRIRV